MVNVEGVTLMQNGFMMQLTPHQTLPVTTPWDSCFTVARAERVPVLVLGEVSQPETETEAPRRPPPQNSKKRKRSFSSLRASPQPASAQCYDRVYRVSDTVENSGWLLNAVEWASTQVSPSATEPHMDLSALQRQNATWMIHEDPSIEATTESESHNEQESSSRRPVPISPLSELNCISPTKSSQIVTLRAVVRSGRTKNQLIHEDVITADETFSTAASSASASLPDSVCTSHVSTQHSSQGCLTEVSPRRELDWHS